MSLAQPPHFIGRKAGPHGCGDGWVLPGHMPSPWSCPLARRRWERPEKLLPSFSEAPRAGLVTLAPQLARDSSRNDPSPGVPAGIAGTGTRSPASPEC